MFTYEDLYARQFWHDERFEKLFFYFNFAPFFCLSYAFEHLIDC